MQGAWLDRMANRRSFRSVLCVLLLLMLTQCASAEDEGEGEEKEKCGKKFNTEEDEETGKCKCLQKEFKMDAKKHCCLPHMINIEDGEHLCQKAPTDLNLAVAGTLILSFSTIVSLQFWTGSSDDDMKRYGYKVITSTISIFCAVLMFQCIDGLLTQFVLNNLPFWFEGESEVSIKYLEFGIDLSHFLVWYIVTQFVLALASNALKSDSWRTQFLKKKTAKDHALVKEFARLKLDIEAGCASYGVVCAHLTGFAAINSWTGLQQCKPFNESPLLALIPLPICLAVQVLLQWTTNTIREWYSSRDSEKDWFEDKWDEQCEDAENDVLGLTLSVMMVNSVRMAINGMNSAGKKCLPNPEQKEEGKFCEEWLEKEGRSTLQISMLFFSGVLFCISLFFVKLVQSKVFPAKEPEGDDGEEDSNIEEEEEEKSCMVSVVDRFTDILICALGMGFSWCFFHANKEMLQKVNPGYLGKEDNVALLASVLALEVTYLGWLTTMILDKISDLPDRWTPPAVDASIVAVIDAIALFIGFAWEQTFDESVDSLASAFRKPLGPNAPAVAKFIFGSFISAFIFWSWKKFTIPFTIRKGWNFGYVFSVLDLDDAVQKLRKNKGGWEGKGRLHEVEIELNHNLHLRALPKSMSRSLSDVGYTALPGDASEASQVAQRDLLIRLKQAEEEKEQAQQTLDQFTEAMLQSLQGINESVRRIEMK